jgi:1-acyl-sn-glycerol-3-phosphate acyltransferase
LDPVVIGIASPRKLNFMARHDLFTHPLFGRIIGSVGAFPVRRNSADLAALKEAIKRVNRGEALLIFPEGRRTDANEDVQPQAGIGFLVKKINAPVIPVFVKGTGEVLPRGAKRFKHGKVFVRFGKEITIERKSPHLDIAQQIMSSIRHLSS